MRREIEKKKEEEKEMNFDEKKGAHDLTEILIFSQF